MNLKYEIKDKAPMFYYPGKYFEVFKEIINLPYGKWLVIGNFKNARDMKCLQAAIPASRVLGEMRKEKSFRIESHRFTEDGVFEIWVRKIRLD